MYGDQENRFVDEGGTEWIWDGEDYVMENNGFYWLFDGEDWLTKDEGGQLWAFDGTDWKIKGADGRFYVQNEMGILVPYNDARGAGQGLGQGPLQAGTGAPNAQGGGGGKAGGKGKHKHHTRRHSSHHHRHRGGHAERHRRSDAAFRKRLQDRINITASLPPPSSAQGQGRRVSELGRAMPGFEVLRAGNGGFHAPGCGGSGFGAQHGGARSSPAQALRIMNPKHCCSHGEGRFTVHTPVAAEKEQQKPGWGTWLKNGLGLCTSTGDAESGSAANGNGLGRNAASTGAHSESLSSRRVSVPGGGSFEMKPLGTGGLRSLQRLGTAGAQGGPALTSSGGGGEEGFRVGPSGDLTPVKGLDVGGGGPAVDVGGFLGQGEGGGEELRGAAKYKHLASALTECTREVGEQTLEAKKRQLQQVAALVAKIGGSGAKGPADELVVALSRVIDSLIEDGFRKGEGGQEGGGFGKATGWDAQEASKLDALRTRLSQALSEAKDTMENVEGGLETTIKLFMDVASNAGTGVSDILKSAEDKANFAKVIDQHLDEIMESRRVLERLSADMSSVVEKAQQFAQRDPSCSCLPRRELLEEDDQLLQERLTEANEQIRLLRERLLVTEIKTMQYKQRGDYAMAQLKVLSAKAVPLNETLQDANEAQERATFEMEKRLELLEHKLDAFNKQKMQQSLTEKLFKLSEEEKRRVGGSGGDSGEGVRSGLNKQLPEIADVIYKKAPILDPPAMPPVVLRMGGGGGMGGGTGGGADGAGLLPNMIRQLQNLQPQMPSGDENKIDQLIAQIKFLMRNIELGATQDDAALARQMSQEITKFAYRDLPAAIPAQDATVVQSLQAMAAKMHNLAQTIRSTRK